MASLSVTAVVPTYNRAQLLQESIASILSQTSMPDEIIVVDDGSTDGSQETITRLIGPIRCVSKPNGGKSSALNRALPLVRTDAVWIFDDDDLAVPDALAALKRGLIERPECGFAYASHQIFTEMPDGTRRLRDADFPAVPADRLFLALLGLAFIHQPGMLVRRACYEAVGPFDEALHRSQDYDMLLRLARRFPAVEVPGPVFLQRSHTGLRGTAQFRVPARAVEATWKHFDQIILRRLREECPLADFLPHMPPGEIAAPMRLLNRAEQFSALLERTVIFARRGLWAPAADDLRSAVTIANEDGVQHLNSAQRGSLHRLFDVFSDGAPDFADAPEFPQALRAVRSRSLARELRAGMTHGLPYRIKLAAAAGRHAEMTALAQIYLRLATPAVFLRGVSRKLVRARQGDQVQAALRTRYWPRSRENTWTSVDSHGARSSQRSKQSR